MCWKCSKFGHQSKECTNTHMSTNQLSNMQSHGVTCWKCSKFGHLTKEYISNNMSNNELSNMQSHSPAANPLMNAQSGLKVPLTRGHIRYPTEISSTRPPVLTQQTLQISNNHQKHGII